jgi:hypothetical protein
MLAGRLLLHQLGSLPGGECVRPAPQPLATGGWCVLVSQGRRSGLSLLRIFRYQFIGPLFIVVLVECLNRLHYPIHQIFFLPEIKLQLRGGTSQLLLPQSGGFLLLRVHHVVEEDIAREFLRLQLAPAVGQSRVL